MRASHGSTWTYTLRPNHGLTQEFTMNAHHFKRASLASFALAVCLAASTPLLAQDAMSSGHTVMVGGAAMYPNKTIVQNAVNSKDHTTLVAAVKAAGLVETLSGPGPFTVFAPTNAAFEKLPKGTVETLLKPENKEKLATILKCHVVATDAMSSAIGKMIKDDKG